MAVHKEAAKTTFFPTQAGILQKYQWAKQALQDMCEAAAANRAHVVLMTSKAHRLCILAGLLAVSPVACDTTPATGWGAVAFFLVTAGCARFPSVVTQKALALGYCGVLLFELMTDPTAKWLNARSSEVWSSLLTRTIAGICFVEFLGFAAINIIFSPVRLVMLGFSWTRAHDEFAELCSVLFFGVVASWLLESGVQETASVCSNEVQPLRSLLDGRYDGIVELNEELRVQRVSPSCFNLLHQAQHHGHADSVAICNPGLLEIPVRPSGSTWDAALTASFDVAFSEFIQDPHSFEAKAAMLASSGGTELSKGERTGLTETETNVLMQLSPTYWCTACLVITRSLDSRGRSRFHVGLCDVVLQDPPGVDLPADQDEELGLTFDAASEELLVVAVHQGGRREVDGQRLAKFLNPNIVQNLRRWLSPLVADSRAGKWSPDRCRHVWGRVQGYEGGVSVHKYAEVVVILPDPARFPNGPYYARLSLIRCAPPSRSTSRSRSRSYSQSQRTRTQSSLESVPERSEPGSPELQRDEDLERDLEAGTLDDEGRVFDVVQLPQAGLGEGDSFNRPTGTSSAPSSTAQRTGIELRAVRLDRQLPDHPGGAIATLGGSSPRTAPSPGPTLLGRTDAMSDKAVAKSL